MIDGIDDIEHGVDFTGRYQLRESENFDKFQEEYGIPFLQRAIACRISVVYDISKDDNDTYTLKTINPLKTTSVSFKLNGDQYVDTTFDGSAVTATTVRRGRKWITTENNGEKSVKIFREFFADKIVTSSTYNYVSFVRIYKKIFNQ